MKQKPKNIILCGFMGSGKTTVGRRLAQKAHMEFIDMDDYIKQREGRTITDIFAQDGEETFRRMETDAARELAGRRGLVIAAGGGTLLRAQNVKIFRKSGVTVLLDTPIGFIQERLKNDTARPLLQKPNRKKVVADLYRKRLPAYCAAADVIVDGCGGADRVAGRVLEQVKRLG